MNRQLGREQKQVLSRCVARWGLHWLGLRKMLHRAIQVRQRKELRLRNRWTRDGLLFAALNLYFGGADHALAAAGSNVHRPD